MARPSPFDDGGTGSRRTGVWRILAPVLLFCVALASHSASPVSQSAADSRWSMHIAMSLIQEGNLDLDEYAGLISDKPDYRLGLFRGHLYSVYPLGAPLLATPFVWVYTIVDPRANDRIEVLHPVLEIAIASFFVALSAIVMYLIFRTELPVRSSVPLSLLYAFGTSAWSTASRALWQHGPSMLMLATTLYLLLLARRRPAVLWLAGLPLACSFVIRPTNIISVIALSIYVFICYRRYFLRYLAAPGLLAVGFFLLNRFTYGTWIPAYYTPGAMLGGSNNVLAGLLGTLWSPSRGLFVFSPVLLLALWGMWAKLTQREDRTLGALLIAIVVLHWGLLSANPYWWGGHSYGPRLFTDILPLLFYFIMFVARCGVSSRLRIPTLFLAILAIPSFLIHFRGATDPVTYGEWNNRPYNVDKAPERLWDWSDPQFLRGVRLVDALVPLRVTALPSEITLSADLAGKSSRQTKIALDDIRSRRFSWTVRSAPNINLSSTGANDVEHVSLTITAPQRPYAQGTHDLGNLEIQVQGTLSGKGELITIPVRLDVTDRHDHYFPIFRTP